MALDARDLREPVRETDGEGGLTQEARAMRTAGRELDAAGDNAALFDLIKELQESVAEQSQHSRIIAKKLDSVLSKLEELIEETAAVEPDEEDSESIQKALLINTREPMREAEHAAVESIKLVSERAQESIENTVKRSTKYIDTLTQESRRRIERLALLTLSSKLFHALKWCALMLALFILVHILWEMFG